MKRSVLSILVFLALVQLLLGASFAVTQNQFSILAPKMGDFQEIEIKIGFGKEEQVPSIYAKKLLIENEKIIEIVGSLYITDSITIDKKGDGRFFLDCTKIINAPEIKGVIDIKSLITFSDLFDGMENGKEISDYGNSDQNVNLYVGPGQERRFRNIYGSNVSIWVYGGIFSAENIQVTGKPGNVYIYNGMKLDSDNEMLCGSAYIESISADNDIRIENYAGHKETVIRVGRIRAGNEIKLVQKAGSKLDKEKDIGFISIGEKNDESLFVLQIRLEPVSTEIDDGQISSSIQKISQQTHSKGGKGSDYEIYYRWGNSGDFEILTDKSYYSKSIAIRTAIPSAYKKFQIIIEPQNYLAYNASGNNIKNLVITLESLPN